MYKFQSSKCKTVGEKLRTKLCPRTDRRKEGHSDSSIPPSTSLWEGWVYNNMPPIVRCGGIKKDRYSITLQQSKQLSHKLLEFVHYFVTIGVTVSSVFKKCSFGSLFSQVIKCSELFNIYSPHHTTEPFFAVHDDSR